MGFTCNGGSSASGRGHDDQTGVKRNSVFGIDPIAPARLKELQPGPLGDVREIRLILGGSRIPRGQQLDLVKFTPGEKRGNVVLCLVLIGGVEWESDKVPAGLQVDRATGCKFLTLDFKDRISKDSFHQEKNKPRRT